MLFGNKFSIKYAQSLIEKRACQLLLFYGPRGVGKRTSASYLASSNFSKHNIYEFLVQGKSSTHLLSSSNMLMDHASSFPLVGDKTCFIFDEAERMNENIISRLLKICEQPDLFILVILISSKINVIPKTIISRSILVPFYHLSYDDVKNVLTYLDMQKVCDSKYFMEGSPGNSILIYELDKMGVINICLKLSDIPIDFESFCNCMIGLEAFSKSVSNLEGEVRSSMQDAFWCFLTSSLSYSKFAKKMNFFKIMKSFSYGIEACNRGLPISVVVEQIWIEFKFISL